MFLYSPFLFFVCHFLHSPFILLLYYFRMATLFEGKQYTSFEELQADLETYQKESKCQLYILDCRTIKAAKHRVPNKKLSEALHYYYVKYSCIHGGKAFKSRSSGARPNRSAFKDGCEMYLYFKTDDGMHLKLHKCNQTHNHELKKDEFEYLPQR